MKETASEWRAPSIKHKMLEGFVGIYLNSLGKKQDHLKNILLFFTQHGILSKHKLKYIRSIYPW